MLTNSEESGTTFTPREFRDALSSFATGVTIVTTVDAQSNPIGMTASSFNSVSTEPPLILWSVTKSALSASAFKEAKNFAVHILATDQTELSNRFAKSGEDKFAGASFEMDSNDVPIIDGCATRFDCSTWAIYEGGDHWIIVGHVNAIVSARKEGLVFGGGSYATAAPLTTTKEKQSANDVRPDGLIDSMLFYHLSRAYHQMADQFHRAVRESGMTVAEWRISASLHGSATRSFNDLMQRTFLDGTSLPDIISNMEEDGLCEITEQDGIFYANGTGKGDKKVEHLFELSKEQEECALRDIDPEAAKKLPNVLRQIVGNSIKAS